MWKNPLNYTPEEKEKSFVLIRKTKSIKHLLYKEQRKIYDLVFDSKERECGFYSSRKIGKTACLLMIFYEYCWKNQGHLTRIVLSDQSHAVDIVEPLIDEFMDKVIPKDMQPRYMLSKKKFIFSNGSIIQLNGGHPDNIEKAAGPFCHLMALDEIAVWKGDVRHALYDILYPQGTLTKMKKIFTCSSPKKISSYYIQNIHPGLQKRNVLVSLTIDECPFMPKEEVDELAKQFGGRDSPEFRRQYLCELIADTNLLITPEFSEELHVIKEINKFITWGTQKVPLKFQYFVVADTGTTRDNTFILLGFFNHHTHELIIEDELVLEINYIERKIDTEKKAKAIISMRDGITDHYDELRGIDVVIDAWPSEHTDYVTKYDIIHSWPRKGKTTEENIGHLKTALNMNKIKISSKCVKLIWDLKYCVWKDNDNVNREIDRISDDKTRYKTHGDGLMALVYMLRAVNWDFSPYENQKLTLRNTQYA